MAEFCPEALGKLVRLLRPVPTMWGLLLRGGRKLTVTSS